MVLSEETGTVMRDLHIKKDTLYRYPERLAYMLTEPSLSYSGLKVSSDEGHVLPEDAIAALAVTENLLEARRIEFDGVLLTPAGFEALIRNPHLSGVRELAFVDCDWSVDPSLQIGSRFGFGLAESHFTSLEVLELAVLEMTDESFAALIASPVFANLRHLRWSRIKLTEASIEAIVNSPWWDQLETLYINEYRLTTNATDILVSAPKPARMSKLFLGSSYINETYPKLVDRFGSVVECPRDWFTLYARYLDSR